jgi:hypothetical protein
LQAFEISHAGNEICKYIFDCEIGQSGRLN